VRLALKRPRDRLIEGGEALVGAFGDEPRPTLSPVRPMLRFFAMRVPLDQVVDILVLQLLKIGCGIVGAIERDQQAPFAGPEALLAYLARLYPPGRDRQRGTPRQPGEGQGTAAGTGGHG
jgi:hypothetical protein